MDRARTAGQAEQGRQDLERVQAWNRACPVGTAVEVAVARGKPILTRTRSLAWLDAMGRPVVLVAACVDRQLLHQVRVALEVVS